MYVEVAAYDPNWPRNFEQIKSELQATLSGISFISIEHVGSTSVPGMPAKPIIDIDIIIEPEYLNDSITALTREGGYAYMGEWGVLGRHAFRKPDARPCRNLYVCIDGCQALRNHLSVRDLCRKDDSVREKYGQLKLELARREWSNVEEYCEAKTDVLCWIMQKAGMSQEDVQGARDVNRNNRIA